MKTLLNRFTWTLVVSVALWGCGGSQNDSSTEKILSDEDDVDLVAHLTGIDDQTAVPAVQEESAEKPIEENAPASVAKSDYIGGKQGAFLGNLMLDGQSAKGSYSVRSASNSGEVIKQNIPVGTEVRLDPGFYDFAFTTPKVVGAPEFMLRDVKIEAGQRTKKDVKMPVGKITLVTGQKCARKPIKIKEKGATDWYKGKFFTCVEMTLMAGEYEAEMGTKKKSVPISGIQVYDGGTRDVLIHNQ